MLKLKPKHIALMNAYRAPFAIGLAVATAIILAGTWPALDKNGSPVAIGAAHADDAAPQPVWAASATGRIEPKSGLIRLFPESTGRINEVLVDTNDVVHEGDPLVILDQRDLSERLRAAIAEADVRKSERSEEAVTGLALDRQNAEDEVADAQRALFAANRAFDAAAIAHHKNGGASSSLESARKKVRDAEKKLADERKKLAELNANPDMPLMNRLESSLAIARSDIAMAEQAIERTIVRAPFDGTVLNVLANVGDLAAPSSREPVVTFGDITSLRVRAEVEERDVAKVRVGQKVVIRADGFPDRDFSGTVTEIASALGSPRIATRGPRRPNDVDVLEVVADVDGNTPLLTGMRVDVFFKRLEGDAKKPDQETKSE